MYISMYACSEQPFSQQRWIFPRAGGTHYLPTALSQPTSIVVFCFLVFRPVREDAFFFVSCWVVCVSLVNGLLFRLNY